MSTPVTSMPQQCVHRCGAPLASDIARSAGLALPSPGSRSHRSGHRCASPAQVARTSSREISCTSTPKLFRQRGSCGLCSTFSRSGVAATLTLPHCFQPVASRPSLQRGVQLNAVFAHLRHVAVRPTCPISPGCVPCGATRSVCPAPAEVASRRQVLALRYAVEQPAMPPPTMMTSAWVGKADIFNLSFIFKSIGGGATTKKVRFRHGKENNDASH